MTDSNSFTSLMDLVESHLSKTSLQATQSDDSTRHLHFPLPNISGVQKGSSDTILTPPNKILPLPRLGIKNSPITEILAQQVTNMLVAKENLKREEAEKQRLAEEMQKMKLQEQEDDYVIDLMSAIIPQDQQIIPPEQETPLSNSSSFESLFTEWNKEIEKDAEPKKEEVELLPITTDMSYILFKKVKKGKCSEFGRVLTARLRPVAAPYLRTIIHNPAVVRFDFSTKSPCDIIKERRLKPAQSKYAHMNMVERFMAITNKEGQYIEDE